jgi:hypothetical protein
VSNIVMSPVEIEAITQYRLPTMQLNELRRQGFFRARMGRRGVVLERGHYNAVVAGQVQGIAAPAANLPKLRLA